MELPPAIENPQDILDCIEIAFMGLDYTETPIENSPFDVPDDFNGSVSLQARERIGYDVAKQSHVTVIQYKMNIIDDGEAIEQVGVLVLWDDLDIDVLYDCIGSYALGWNDDDVFDFLPADTIDEFRASVKNALAAVTEL